MADDFINRAEKFTKTTMIPNKPPPPEPGIVDKTISAGREALNTGKKFLGGLLKSESTVDNPLKGFFGLGEKEGKKLVDKQKVLIEQQMGEKLD